MLKGRAADEQIIALAGLFNDSQPDFTREIAANHVAVQINFPYWVRSDFTRHGLSPQRKAEVLRGIVQVWTDRFPDVTLVAVDDIDT